MNRDHWVNLTLQVVGLVATVLGTAATWHDVPHVFTPMSVSGLILSAIGIYSSTVTDAPRPN